jgi:hypothetical protein
MHPCHLTIRMSALNQAGCHNCTGVCKSGQNACGGAARFSGRIVKQPRALESRPALRLQEEKPRPVPAQRWGEHPIFPLFWRDRVSTSQCRLNFRTVVKYYPTGNKVIAWDLGQVPTFPATWSLSQACRTLILTTPGSNCPRTCRVKRMRS